MRVIETTSDDSHADNSPKTPCTSRIQANRSSWRRPREQILTDTLVKVTIEAESKASKTNVKKRINEV